MGSLRRLVQWQRVRFHVHLEERVRLAYPPLRLGVRPDQLELGELVDGIQLLLADFDPMIAPRQIRNGLLVGLQATLDQQPVRVGHKPRPHRLPTVGTEMRLIDAKTEPNPVFNVHGSTPCFGPHALFRLQILEGEGQSIVFDFDGRRTPAKATEQVGATAHLFGIVLVSHALRPTLPLVGRQGDVRTNLPFPPMKAVDRLRLIGIHV